MVAFDRLGPLELFERLERAPSHASCQLLNTVPGSG